MSEADKPVLLTIKQIASLSKSLAIGHGPMLPIKTLEMIAPVNEKDNKGF